jgi:geranylgeranyl pyrophosphate synthase
MYQIVDDLIDVLQSPEHTGKATGKDHSAGKVTFPGVMGIEQSRSEVNRLRQAARDEVARLGAPADLLVQLCDYMAIRTR